MTQPEEWVKQQQKITQLFDKKIADWQKKLVEQQIHDAKFMQGGPTGPPGPPGPMGLQGEKGEPGRLLLPAGDYTAQEVNKLIREQNATGITLSEGEFHISGSGPGTVVRGNGYVPTAKAHPSAYKPGKKPQDRKKKPTAKWTQQEMENQREVVERATKLLEDKVLLIQILEAQVDDMRAANDSLLKRIEGLEKRLEEHDDRINWLET